MFTVFNLTGLFARTVRLICVCPTLTPNGLFSATRTRTLAILSNNSGVTNFRRTITVTNIRPNGTATRRLRFRHTLIRVRAIRINGFMFTTDEKLRKNNFLYRNKIMRMRSKSNVITFEVNELFFRQSNFTINVGLRCAMNAKILSMVAGSTNALICKDNALRRNKRTLAMRRIITRGGTTQSTIRRLYARRGNLYRSIKVLLCLVKGKRARFFTNSRRLTRRKWIA